MTTAEQFTLFGEPETVTTEPCRLCGTSKNRTKSPLQICKGCYNAIGQHARRQAALTRAPHTRTLHACIGSPSSSSSPLPSGSGIGKTPTRTRHDAQSTPTSISRFTLRSA